MIEVEISNLKWLEPDPDQDLCSHGNISLSIDSFNVSSDSNEWTLTWAARNLAFTYFNDYNPQSEDAMSNQLIPCCGFSFFMHEGKVFTLGCPSGIDWTIIHEGSNLIHRFSDGTVCQTTKKEWGICCLKITESVVKFYGDSPIRVMRDVDDVGFKTFCDEWRKSYDNICSDLGFESKWNELSLNKI